MTSQAPVMLSFIALFKTAMRKFEFYPMKKASLHGRINEKSSRLSLSRPTRIVKHSGSDRSQ
jgi:hypothetical protein